jgi:hypothetical protein
MYAFLLARFPVLIFLPSVAADNGLSISALDVSNVEIAFQAILTDRVSH